MAAPASLDAEDASSADLGELVLLDAEGGASTCAICLGVVESAAMVSACFHTYCYVCIVQWSEVNPTCPLCKAPIGSLIHDIVSDVEFTETPVQSRHESRLSARQRPAATRSPAQWGPPAAGRGTSISTQRRRRVYLRGLVPLPISDARLSKRRQQRHSSAALGGGGGRSGSGGVSFATAAAIVCSEEEWLRRGRAWAERDLQCLLDGDDVQTLVLLLAAMLKRAGGDLRSQWLQEEWKGYLGDFAGIFLREFGCFLSTPFDMRTYDALVRYADLQTFQ